MKALPLSPKFASLRPGSPVFLSSPAGVLEVTIKSLRPAGRHFSIAFVGVDDRESASRWRDCLLKVERRSIPLEEGEFFWDELIGMTVLTSEGMIIGEVEDIIETGSNDVYVVRGTGREYLIPAIGDVIKEIDRKGGKILVEVMEGMLD